MQFLLIVYYRRELFQIKSLTWILEHALLVGDSKDTPNKEVVLDLPTMRVRDLCQRAARREMETGRKQILAIDLDTQTYKHSCMDWMMESIRSKLEPETRLRVDD